MRRRPVIALVLLSLLVSSVPVSAAGQRAEEPGRIAAAAPGNQFGEELDQEPRIPPCEEPPCEPSETTSGGTGGYIPVPAQRVLDTRSDPGHPIGRGQTLTVEIGGVGSIPADDVQAVALSVTASDASGWSSLTVWPTGSPKPDAPNLSIQPGRPQRTVVVVPLGSNGTVSVYNDRGHVEVIIDVIGRFAWDTEYRPVAPVRLFDSGPGKGKPHPIAPGGAIDLAVTGRAGIPAQGVRAVVLNVASRTSTEVSAVTVWPKSQARPSGPSLVVQPTDRRDNVVIVAPGADGEVSVHNQRGWTHLSVDLVGWLPSDSSFRPVASSLVFDSRDAHPAGLPAGGLVEIQLTGHGGVPAVSDDPGVEAAHAVALNIVSTSRESLATTLSAWPTGDYPLDTVSLATTANSSGTASFTIVPLGEGGKVSLSNNAAAADVQVQVVGWFATPIVAAQLEVPDTTIAPAPADVADIAVETEPDGTVTGATVELDPEAPRVAVGDHLVFGVTDATPEGLLGTVTTVTPTAGGGQVVTTEPAMLEDVFPEGDIEVNLNADTDYEEQLLWSPEGPVGLSAGMSLPAAAQPSSGVKVDFEYIGDGKKGKDDRGAECSMDGIEASFGPVIDMQFHVRWRWMKAPVVTALATLGAEARLALRDVSVQCGFDIRLWRAIVTFTAGPVPVVVVFSVGAALDIAAGLDGLDIGASAGAYITLGVKNNKGYADASYDFEATTFDEALVQARQLSAYAMADAWLTFDVMLYKIIGPSISVGPFIETALTMADDQPWWRLDFGLAGRIKLKLDLWFHTWNWKLYAAEIPLADLLVAVGALDSCRALDDPAYEEPCRSPKPATRADGKTPDRTLASRIRLVSSGEKLQLLGIDALEMPLGRVGQPYSVQFDATGLLLPGDHVVWTLDGGIPGLSLDSVGGRLEGTPTTAGTYVVEISVRYGSDPASMSRATKTVSVTVIPEVVPPPVLGSIDVGYTHACAIVAGGPAAGSLACWGANEGGQLGYATPGLLYSTVPALVDGLAGVTSVSTGLFHSCALTSDGTVACWGDNYQGQLGNGTFSGAGTPEAVTGLADVTAISAGYQHTCAIRLDGTVACWGGNEFGQLGIGTTDNESTPQLVSGLPYITAIAAGAQHTCALDASGQLYCWGGNSSGQLGDGGTTDAASPQPVTTLPGVTFVAADLEHTCAVTTDGIAFCWGGNSSGQLGYPTSEEQPYSPTPQQVTGLPGVTTVTTGMSHSCALNRDGTVSCWGGDSDGQLGERRRTGWPPPATRDGSVERDRRCGWPHERVFPHVGRSRFPAAVLLGRQLHGAAGDRRVRGWLGGAGARPGALKRNRRAPRRRRGVRPSSRTRFHGRRNGSLESGGDEPAGASRPPAGSPVPSTPSIRR